MKMMIRSIRLERFRGVQEGFIDDLRQVTLLIGRNGSGKSSILEALYMMSACSSPIDDVRGINKLDYVVNRRGSRGSWDDARSILWYTLDTSNPITIELGIREGKCTFQIFDAPLSHRPVRLKTPAGFVELAEGYCAKSPQELWLTTSRIDIKGLTELRDYLRGFLFIDRHLLAKPKAIEKSSWSKVAAKRLDKQIIFMIREEFEVDAESLTYIPIGDEYCLALQTSETTTRVDDLGDGARAALLSSLLILAYRPTLVLIEEPELHMHPAGLYTYMKFLLKLMKQFNAQLIASTHSIELVQITEALAKELNLDFTVKFIEREKGVLKARSFSSDDIEMLRKLGIDPRLLHKF
ncbi:MAG: hypothetical protein DRM97_02730 [Thermoprotei archaeon]|nr:MAG: hypothetical protein DRM97_02730 [Thermoprotei archaeon]